MPDYEINFYLANGGKATVKMENFNGTAQNLEANIRAQMDQPDNDLYLTGNTLIVRLKKNDVVGYSIDSLS
jgi:hypothetical protein